MSYNYSSLMFGLRSLISSPSVGIFHLPSLLLCCKSVWIILRSMFSFVTQDKDKCTEQKVLVIALFQNSSKFFLQVVILHSYILNNKIYLTLLYAFFLLKNTQTVAMHRI